MSKKHSSSPNDSLLQSTRDTSASRTGGLDNDRGSLEASSFGFGGGSTRSRLLTSQSAQMGGGSYKSYILDHLARMHSDIESTTRKLELEQRRLFKLDKELDMAEQEYSQKRKRFRLQQPPQDDASGNRAIEVKQLERRLEKAIADLNQGTFHNEQLREQIDQLRKERQILDTVFRQVEKGIVSNKKSMSRIKGTMNDEKLGCEEAKQKAKALEKMLERERKRFKAECERLQEDVQLQSSVQKEQEKKSRSSEAGDAQTKKSGKNRRTYMVADEEEAFSEQLMHRRILKLSFLNTIQRRHIKQHQQNIEVFEQAFSTIKSSTGISDIEEIVKIFIGLEQRNFSLLTYVNQLNREIESIEIRNRDLRTQLKNYQEDQTQSSARKDAALSDLLLQIGKTQNATSEKDGMIEESIVALRDCRPLILRIVKYLKQEIPALIQSGYEGDFPPMKVSPPDEHEENLTPFLMYIEEAIYQFRVSLSHSALAPGSTLPAQPKSAHASSGVRKPGDLPSAHIAGDDSDDDTESGLADRPWTRSELRDRAQAMIARRRKGNKGQLGGRGIHEESSGTQLQPASSGAGGGRPGPGVESGKRIGNSGDVGSSAGGNDEMGPPAKDYAASSIASKESKDDSGPTGSASGGFPQGSDSTGAGGNGEEGSNSRDGMWWRSKGIERGR